MQPAIPTGFFAGVAGLGLLFWAVAIILPIWALIDLIGKPMQTANKIIWALVILFFPFIGAIVSLIVNRGGSRSPA